MPHSVTALKNEKIGVLLSPAWRLGAALHCRLSVGAVQTKRVNVWLVLVDKVEQISKYIIPFI